MITGKEKRAEKVTAWTEEINQENQGEKGGREIPIIEDTAEIEKNQETTEVQAGIEIEIRDQGTMIKAEIEEEEITAEDVLQIEGEEIKRMIRASTETGIDLAVIEEVREKGHIVREK